MSFSRSVAQKSYIHKVIHATILIHPADSVAVQFGGDIQAKNIWVVFNVYQF